MRQNKVITKNIPTLFELSLNCIVKHIPPTILPLLDLVSKIISYLPPQFQKRQLPEDFNDALAENIKCWLLLIITAFQVGAHDNNDQDSDMEKIKMDLVQKGFNMDLKYISALYQLRSTWNQLFAELERVCSACNIESKTIEYTYDSNLLPDFSASLEKRCGEKFQKIYCKDQQFLASGGQLGLNPMIEKIDLMKALFIAACTYGLQHLLSEFKGLSYSTQRAVFSVLTPDLIKTIVRKKYLDFLKQLVQQREDFTILAKDPKEQVRQKNSFKYFLIQTLFAARDEGNELFFDFLLQKLFNLTQAISFKDRLIHSELKLITCLSDLYVKFSLDHFHPIFLKLLASYLTPAEFLEFEEAVQQSLLKRDEGWIPERVFVNPIKYEKASAQAIQVLKDYCANLTEKITPNLSS